MPDMGYGIWDETDFLPLSPADEFSYYCDSRGSRYYEFTI